MFRALSASLAILIALHLGQESVQAQTWSGSSDAFWTNTANWIGGVVPISGNTATFNSASSNTTVDLGGAARAIGSFLFDTSSAAAFTFSGNTGDAFLIDAGGAITVNSTVTTAQTFNTGLQFLGGFSTANNGTGLLTLAGGISLGSGGTAGLFTVGGTGNTIISGTIASGAITGLTKSGSGTLILSGSNAFSGVTSILGGTLSLAADDRLGTAPGSATAGQLVINGGTLAVTTGFTLSANRGIALGPTSGSGTGTIDVAASQTLTYSGIVANNPGGSGNLTKTGSGTLILGGLNTFDGKVTVSAGTLTFYSIGNVGGGASALGAPTTVANGTIDLSGTLNFSSTPGGTTDRIINVNGGVTIQNSGTGMLTLNGNITGNSNNILFRGNNNITMNGQILNTNTTGTLSRTDSGTLFLTNAANAFTGNLSIAVGTIDASSIANSGSASAIGAGSSITLGQNNSLSAGTFNFSGSSGGSTNRSWSLQRGTSTSSTWAIANSVSGQLLSLSGNIAQTGTGTSTTNTLTFGGAGDGLFSGAITGSPAISVSKTGNGTWTLSGTNSYTGTTSISAGTLQVGSGSTTGQLGTGNVSIAGTLVYNRSDAISLSNVFSGAGTFTQQGAGTTTLSGGSSFTGTMNVTGGGVKLTGSMGTLTALNVSGGGVFENNSSANPLTVTSAITLPAGSGTGEIQITPLTTADRTISASGGLTINSGGTLRLNANNDGSSQRASQLTGNVSLNSGGAVIVTPSTLTSSANSRVINGNFSMTGGTVTIDTGTAAQSRLQVNGAVSVSGGIFNRGSGTNSTAAQFVMTGSANSFSPTSYDPTMVLSLQGADQSLSVTVPAGVIHLRNTSNSANLVYTKTLFSTSTIGRLGFGVATSGNTCNLVLGNNLKATDSPTSNSMPQAEFGLTNVGVTNQGIDTAGFTLDLTAARASGGSVTWTPGFTGSGTAVWNLTNSGAAGQGGIKVTNVVFNAASTTVNIGAGAVIELTGGNSTGIVASTAGTWNAASTLKYSGSAATATPAFLTSTSTLGNLIVQNGALRINSSSLTAAGALTVDQGGTLDLSTNGLTAGGLTLGSNGAAGTVSGANTLTLTATASVVNGSIASPIAGSGINLTKSGSGTTVTLTGANTYSGNTTISAGTLVVNNATGSATGTGTVTVQSGGSLGGGSNTGTAFTGSMTGFISGNVTVNANGIVAPGNSVGTLTVGSATFASDAVLNIELGSANVRVGGTPADNNSNDRIYSSAGSIAFGANLTLNVNGAGQSFTVGNVYDYFIAQGSSVTIPTNPTFNPSNFSSPGSFALSQQGNAMVLTFTPVPEPTLVTGLLLAGVGGVTWWRRRKV